MLTIHIPDRDNLWDEETKSLVKIKGGTMTLEHSLISIKKWEKKWHKSFLDTDNKTFQEIIDYIRCMTINSTNNNPALYNFIPNSEIKKVVEYIKDPMTATWFSESPTSYAKTLNNGEVVTAEIIYYWMISMNIPSEYQKWHLNELLTLIRVISLKSSPPKKMSPSEERSRRHALNAARKKKYNTKG